MKAALYWSIQHDLKAALTTDCDASMLELDYAGYGFVSFSDAVEGAKALREMNGKYIGNRPCKLRKSSWEERTPQNSYKGKRKGGENQGNQAKKPGIFHK